MKYIKKSAFITMTLPITFIFSKVLTLFFNYEITIISTLIVTIVIAITNLENKFDLFSKTSKLDISFYENNSGKVISYIINLDTASERLNYILPQIERLNIPYERISAIDGRKLKKKKLDTLLDTKSYKAFFKMPPEPGTIGCFLSHEKAWRAFLASDKEFAIIFEDDVKFDPEELKDIIFQLTKKKNMWDIVGLELNHYGHPVKISTLTIKRYLCIYLTEVKHTGAYIINRKTAFLMLEKMYPIKMPIDHYFTRSWEFEVKFCGVEPRLVKQQFGGSQIKIESTEKFGFIELFLKNFFVKHLAYNIYSSCMKTLYNMYTYIYYIFGLL